MNTMTRGIGMTSQRTRDRLVERLREVIGDGARNLIFSQFVEDEIGFMELLGREVLPRVRD